MIKNLMNKTITFLSIAGILYLLPVTCFSGENKWTKVGKICTKNLKGQLNSLLVNPSNNKILYAIVNDSLVKKSIDGGNKWSLINKGLRCKKINKLIISPFQIDTLYACADRGLFVFNYKQKEWSLISFQGISIFAIAIENQAPYQVRYAATEFQIYKSSQSNSWQPLSHILPDTIRAIGISMESSKEYLYVGTERGIYKISETDSILTPKGQNIAKRKIIDVTIKAIPQFIFAATDSGGVYYTHSSEWKWQNINNGWQDSFPFISSMNLNQKKTCILLVATNDGNIFKYNFVFPRIAILEFGSLEITPWERTRINNYLHSKLKKTYFVKFVEKKKLSLIETGLITPDELKSFGKALGREYGFEIVIVGNILVQSDNLIITPTIIYVTMDRDTTLKGSQKKKESYYPGIIKEVAYNINCEIKGKGYAIFIRYFWDTPLKWILGGIFAGNVYCSIKNNFEKSKAVNSIPKDGLPNPNPFFND